MTNNVAIRAYPLRVETRNVKRAGYLDKGLQGYAVVYDTLSRDMGGWFEIIARGAMKESLGKKLDVRLLSQHDNRSVMAREQAGNLVLREDTQGVYFEADLLDITLNRDNLASVQAGNLDAMSFGMPYSSVQRQWERRDKQTVSTVTRADVVEISVVTWAAYEETTVSARSLDAAQKEFDNFMQHDAAGKGSSLGSLRARRELLRSRYRY